MRPAAGAFALLALLAFAAFHLFALALSHALALLVFAAFHLLAFAALHLLACGVLAFAALHLFALTGHAALVLFTLAESHALALFAFAALHLLASAVPALLMLALHSAFVLLMHSAFVLATALVHVALERFVKSVFVLLDLLELPVHALYVFLEFAAEALLMPFEFLHLLPEQALGFAAGRAAFTVRSTLWRRASVPGALLRLGVRRSVRGPARMGTGRGMGRAGQVPFHGLQFQAPFHGLEVEGPFVLLHLQAESQLAALALVHVHLELVGVVEFFRDALHHLRDVGRGNEDHGVGRLVQGDGNLLEALAQMLVLGQLMERLEERFGRDVLEPQDNGLRRRPVAARRLRTPSLGAQRLVAGASRALGRCGSHKHRDHRRSQTAHIGDAFHDRPPL